jgi:hypothetical protein
MRLLVVRCTLVSVLVGLSSAHLLSQDQKRSRAVGRGDVPIISLLQPDDEVLLMIDQAHYVRPGFERPNDLLEYATSTSSMIVQARLIDEESMLVGNGGSWIGRRLRFAVTRRFVGRPGVPRVPPGSEVDVYADGGELLVKGVTVRATPATVYSRGQSYVLFLHLRAGYAPTGTSIEPLLVTEGRVKSVESETSLLDGMTVSELAKRVRQIAPKI